MSKIRKSALYKSDAWTLRSAQCHIAKSCNRQSTKGYWEYNDRTPRVAIRHQSLQWQHKRRKTRDSPRPSRFRSRGCSKTSRQALQGRIGILIDPEYFSHHMKAVLDTLVRPMFLSGIYKLCRVQGVPDSSVRRILSTFKAEKLVIKKDGKWEKT